MMKGRSVLREPHKFDSFDFLLLFQRCKRPLNPTITLPKPTPGPHPKFYLAEKYPLPRAILKAILEVG